MQAVSRFTLAILIAIITSLGAFSLVGCTDDTQQPQSAAQSEVAASEASDNGAAEDDEQDNCYGDDLPAKKS